VNKAVRESKRSTVGIKYSMRDLICTN